MPSPLGSSFIASFEPLLQRLISEMNLAQTVCVVTNQLTKSKVNLQSNVVLIEEEETFYISVIEETIQEKRVT